MSRQGHEAARRAFRTRGMVSNGVEPDRSDEMRLAQSAISQAAGFPPETPNDRPGSGAPSFGVRMDRRDSRAERRGDSNHPIRPVWKPVRRSFPSFIVLSSFGGFDGGEGGLSGSESNMRWGIPVSSGMTPNLFRCSRRTLSLCIVLALAAQPARSAEYVTTRSAGGSTSGYPLVVPEGAFVELVQIGGVHEYVRNLRLRFADGRVHENLLVWNRIHHGFKFAGLSRIEFTGSRNHAALWKITPAEEFGLEEAEYVTVIPGQASTVPGAGYEVPEDRTVRIVQAVDTGFDDAESDWASVRLDSSVPGLTTVSLIPTPSEPFPFLTEVQCDTFVLLEVMPVQPADRMTLTVEESGDLKQWDPVRSFEIESTEERRFFRTRIGR